MEVASNGRVAHRRDTKGGRRHEGFSLLEMMMVVTLIRKALSHQLSANPSDDELRTEC
jgi:competence protein ComGC